MLAMPARGTRASVPGERVRPGEIALTVIPKGASSLANARVMPTMPALLAMHTIVDSSYLGLLRPTKKNAK
jgi:hypothetical protein